jgi:hypothetical protein
MTVTSAQYRDLEVKRGELRRRYDTMTKRLAALDTDIGRELDSERKLVLEQRRADLTAERDQVLNEMTEIELRLGGGQETPTRARREGDVMHSRQGKAGPKVIETDPPNGATNVPRDLTTIRIRFDRPMDSEAGSLTQAGGFGLGNAEMHYDAASHAFSFTRDNPGLLPANTAITFVVNPDEPPGPGFADLQGVSAEKFRLSFTTGSRPTDEEWATAQERASLQRQLAELRENLSLIEERKSQFVQETDVPLQLIKDERRVRQQITEVADRLNRLK